MGLTFNPFTGTFDFTGSSGGGGTIAGTIAATQVAFGTALDTIGGSADLTWDGTTVTVAAGDGFGVRNAANDATLSLAQSSPATVVDFPVNWLKYGASTASSSAPITIGNIRNFYFSHPGTLALSNSVFIDNAPDIEFEHTSQTASHLIAIGPGNYFVTNNPLDSIEKTLLIGFNNRARAAAGDNQGAITELVAIGVSNSFTTDPNVLGNLSTSALIGDNNSVVGSSGHLFAFGANNHLTGGSGGGNSDAVAIGISNTDAFGFDNITVGQLITTAESSIEIFGVGSADIAGLKAVIQSYNLIPPTAPQQGMWWVDASGSPAVYALKVRDSGSTHTIASSAGGITVGTTPIASGTTTRILYDNAGVLGEYTITGTGTVVAMATSPTFTTPLLGTPTSGNLMNCTGYPAGSVSGATALTKTDDTNVTLTLGGTPSTALLQAASITAGWTGTLAVARGGTGTGTAAITAFNNITGYAAAGATGTTSTNLVFSTSPTLVTPLLGTPTSGVLTNCTGLTESGLTLSDVTTANVSATAHGFAPKFPNNTTTFLRGDGTYAVPPGTATGTVTSIATTSPISGGTITTTGTLSLLVNVDYLFTHSQTITPGSAGQGGLTITGNTESASNPALSTTQTNSATSGTLIHALLSPTFSSGSTSTMVGVGLKIAPTINYSAGTPGAGSYEALKIAVTETALPTGTNYLIRASSGAAGTTDVLRVSTGGVLSLTTGASGTRTLSVVSNVLTVDGPIASTSNSGWGNGFASLTGGNGNGNDVNVTTANGNLVFKAGTTNVFEFRNSTSAQIVDIYNTFTSTTNFERLMFDWATTANVAMIYTQKGSGGGTARVLQLNYGGTTTSAISIPITSGAITFGGNITTLGGATLHTTSTALTDGAGSSVGTLATAPAAGNPTKWIGINDNGTTRYIPAW